MQEVWKDVVGFEGYFKVSDEGRVFSKRSCRVLKQGTLPSGYKVISTRIGGRQGVAYCLRVHRLVAEAFLPSPDKALEDVCSKQGYGVVLVRHLDNNKLNCHVSNLAWGSYQDNADDFHNGFSDSWLESLSGTNSHTAKLTGAQVAEIRKIYTPHCKVSGARALAKRFGVDHSCVSRAARSETFKDNIRQPNIG